LTSNRFFGVICKVLFREPGFALTPVMGRLGITAATIKPPPPVVERRVPSVCWVGGVVGVGGWIVVWVWVVVLVGVVVGVVVVGSGCGSNRAWVESWVGVVVAGGVGGSGKGSGVREAEGILGGRTGRSPRWTAR
jgi:hypothetical protein